MHSYSPITALNIRSHLSLKAVNIHIIIQVGKSMLLNVVLLFFSDIEQFKRTRRELR